MTNVHTVRPRAASSAAEPNNTLHQHRVASPSRHARTSSEFSGTRRLASPVTNRSPLRTRQQAPLHSTADDMNGRGPVTQQSLERETYRLTLGDGIGTGADLGRNNFMGTNESENEPPSRPTGTVLIQHADAEPLPEKPLGLSFDELVDRLLAQPMSRADANFTETFLCLYRKFAAPGVLLSAILDRLEEAAEDKSQHFLIRTNRQLRIVGVLTKWLMTYPGDFASPQTRERLVGFVEQISMEPAFSYAALEMKIALRTTVIDDDDTRWELADPDYESGKDSSKKTTPASSIRSAQASRTASKSSLIEDAVSRRQSEAISEQSAISVEPSLIESGRPSGIHTVQEYEIEAACIVPSKHHPLTKARWQHCLDIADEDWANEITRIDWVLFSSVRVRDLLRDITLSPAQKAKFRSLVNVSRAINHFNHLASWVTNLILLREKPKHRALMMEKFMRIAWKLRQMNNYNGLAAVMAGLQNTAVMRMAQTQALISPDDRKNFMRLEILMNPRKSHFAYRLAWQNSPLPRIPYMPLCRRDLTSANGGSKTLIDERINWKKMEVFGVVILPIIASYGSTYRLHSNPSLRQLILDTDVVTDDEALFQRSVALEASSNPQDRSLLQRARDALR